MRSTKLALLLLFLPLCACATWSTSSVDFKGKTVQSRPAKKPSDVLISEEDITKRPYKSLGDIEVVVRKTTIFNADPTPQLVNEKLQEKAAEMGADAVVLVRYGTVGVGFFSWGTLEGRGRAVVFK